MYDTFIQGTAKNSKRVASVSSTYAAYSDREEEEESVVVNAEEDVHENGRMAVQHVKF